MKQASAGDSTPLLINQRCKSMKVEESAEDPSHSRSRIPADHQPQTNQRHVRTGHPTPTHRCRSLALGAKRERRFVGNSLIIRVATTISLYSGYSRTRSVFSFALWQQRSQISQLKARVRIDSAPRHQPIISRYKPHIDNAGHQSLTTRRQRTQPRVILTVT
jgi:hypothetical protein